MKLIHLFLVIASGLALGCQSKPPRDLNAMHGKVRMGMSEAEVVTAIGQPDSKNDAPGVRLMMYDSGDEMLTVMVSIPSDKVVRATVSNLSE